ncbi:MAG: hypothetical protein GTO02_22400 [Candidatus Dadabacteria bacterium]|nr:hypothetical protein [Candidatus Dadabacteria bacterium]
MKKVKKFCKSCNCGEDITEDMMYETDSENNKSYRDGELWSCEGFEKSEYVCDECNTVYGHERHWITDNGGESNSIDGKDIDSDSFSWQENGIRYEHKCCECFTDFVYSYDKYGIMKNEDGLCLKCTKKEQKEFLKQQKQKQLEASYKGRVK